MFLFTKQKNIYVCSKHRSQLDRHNKILERTRFDLNKIIILENHAEIIMDNDNSKFLINLEDVELIKQYKWRSSMGYAMAKVNGKQTFMHRLINNTPINLYTDHINRDTYDNRRSNLRTVTSSENALNVKKEKLLF